MKNQPIRMCITCRKREPQRLLTRLQLLDSNIVPYSGVGRSFYLCKSCCSDEKRVIGVSKRFKIDITEFKETLKEINKYG